MFDNESFNRMFTVTFCTVIILIVFSVALGAVVICGGIGLTAYGIWRYERISNDVQSVIYDDEYENTTEAIIGKEAYKEHYK
jgi:uncharacterized membrane protein YidH (DUF202 family)